MPGADAASRWIQGSLCRVLAGRTDHGNIPQHSRTGGAHRKNPKAKANPSGTEVVAIQVVLQDVATGRQRPRDPLARAQHEPRSLLPRWADAGNLRLPGADDATRSYWMSILSTCVNWTTGQERLTIRSPKEASNTATRNCLLPTAAPWSRPARTRRSSVGRSDRREL